MPDESPEPPDHARSESAQPSTTGRRVETALLWSLVGLGVGALVGALVVAAYTLFGATRATDCALDGCVTITHLATSMAWVVVAAAAVILVGLLVLTRLRNNARARTTKWVCSVSALAAVGVVARYLPAGYDGGPMAVRGATLMIRVDEDKRTSVLGFAP